MPPTSAKVEIAGHPRSYRAYRLLISVICVCCVIAVFRAGGAAAASRHATMAIDANTGETLHAESGDELRHLASLTKMMTIYMVFEQLEAGDRKSVV